MQKVTLGKSGLVVPKNGYGALPIQRVQNMDEAVYLLQKALDNGMYYFDTARAYTNSEEKLGRAFGDRREKIIVSTKTEAKTTEEFWSDLETSLKTLHTDHIDLYQFHNPSFCPKPNDGTGLYEAAQEAIKQGKILHLGVTNHRLKVAHEVIESGLYETIQFPFSYLASDDDLSVVKSAKEHNMGFIAMKGLAGGLINHAATAYAFMAQFDHVVPIWGIQREKELDEFLSFMNNPPVLTDEMKARIENDKKILSGEFCRGCGYCMPCPAGITISECNRMYLFLRRAPYGTYLTKEYYDIMQKVKDCKKCGRCKTKCPYNLDIPNLLVRNYNDFMEHWSRKSELNPEE